jgi:long-chain acyl-CoA synthetase
MPQTQLHFSWNTQCALHPYGGPNALPSAHHNAVVSLRAAIDAQQSIRLVHGEPIALHTSKGQLFCATGGSTGIPKIIARSQASWIKSFEINRVLFSITAHDCVAVFGDIMHSLALYGVIEAAHIGADILMLAGLRPKAQRDQLQQARATILYITPTQLKMLLSAKPKAAHLRHIIIGGGAVSTQLQELASHHFPNATMTQFYGASETSFITMANETTPQGSVGLPYPDVSVKIIGEDGDTRADIGEVWVKSPYLFDGYAQGDGPDTQLKDGFITIGEMGRLDGAGNLFLLGRKSRMVTIADQNVFPEQIEAFITKTCEIQSVVVLATPDPMRGHILTAILQGSADSAEQISQACRDHFGPLKSPRHVVFIDHIPLLQSGKPDLITLAHWLEAQT